MLYTACSAPIGSAGPRRSAGCGAASCSTSRSRRWRWRRADAAMASVTSIQYSAARLSLHRRSVRHSGRTVWRHPPAHFNRHWISMSDSTLVYQDLSPDRILAAVEKTGLHCNGHLHALNSYENRAYQIGLDDGSYVVAKFYRPGRWSDAAILEEHAYALELAEREIPVVAPLRDERGETLHHHDGFRYTLYPRRGGRWPELDDPDILVWLGRFIARIHAVGAIEPFHHRPTLTIEDYCYASYRFVLEL